MNAAEILITTALLLGQQQNVVSETRVSLYMFPNYNLGIYLGPVDLDNYSYYRFGWPWNNEISSFKILTGSCVEMHKNNPPSYSNPSSWYWTSNLANANMKSGFNNIVSSVKKCGAYTRSLQCPEGSFVKKMKWDGAGGMLRNGIELYCSHPNGSSWTPGATLRTHGSSTLYGSTECSGAIRGIRYITDTRRLAQVDITPLCSTPQTSANTLSCDADKAISGLRLTIENNSGFIKSFNVVCTKLIISNIESTCVARDKRNVLFTCDSSQAMYPLKCTHEKSVGYGLTKTLSEELRKEYEFHEELGFDIGAAGFGLSANFRATLGYSETTGYSWTETQESTFNEETTITVEAEAPGGCITKVSEIIGECSFMQVRPNYFQRQDNCSGMVFNTDVVIPKNFKSRLFVSKIPDVVLKYIHAV